jgi:TonB-linked SusC/RagA family outer membrane protein
VIALEAVVVTGTGAAVEKKQLGNTIATVDMSRIEDAPVQTFSEILSGRDPSVNLMAASGLAGAGARIRIRGTNSLSMSNEPVVYLDGVRIDNGGAFVNGGQNAGEPSRLDDISPESIDRVEILKGAAAATLYGSEASGGVIQIFTKRGQQGRPRFSLRVEQGMLQEPDVFKPNHGFARTAGQADTINATFSGTEDWTNVGVYDVFSRDFVDDMLTTGHSQTYSAAVSGGGEAVTYYVAGRFARTDGPLGGEILGPARDKDRRIQGNATITIFPRERLSFRIGALFTDSKHDVPQNGNNIYGVMPLLMDAKPEQASCTEAITGTLGKHTPMCVGNPNGLSAFMTPREAMQQETSMDAEHFNGNVTASWQITNTLDLETTFGIDVTNASNFEYGEFGYDVDDFTGKRTDGYRWLGGRNHRELSLDIKGNWSTRLGEMFSSQFTVGAQGFISTNKTTGGDGWDFPGPGLKVTEAAANQVTYENWLQVVNTGVFAQEQIGFNDYAYLTVGGRWDKNSAFGENTGGAFYPKVGFSIIPSDMPGWSGALLSTFRIRGAIGKSGLQPGAFDQFTTYQAGATWEGAGLYPDNLGNENLKPEKATEIEGGAEFGLFDNRVGLEATYWHRVTKDALVRRQFPLTGGFYEEQLDNIGELKGQGLELKFDWLAMDNENMSISLFATGSWIKERIVSMGTAPPIKVGGSYPRYRNYLRGPEDWDNDGTIESFAPGAFFGGALVDYTPGSTVPFDSDGDGLPDSESDFRAWLMAETSGEGGVGSVSLDASGMQPLLRDDDGDGDNLDSYIGKPSPDWQGAFGANFTFQQNLDLNVMLEFKAGNFMVNNLTDAFRNSNPLIGRNTLGGATTEATLMDPSRSEEEKFQAAMDWATKWKALAPHSGLNTHYNADFLRLRELGITWRAPANVAGTFGLDNMTFSLTGRNLYKWDSYPGIDQEMNAISRQAGGGTDDNFLDSVDAWGMALPRRYTVSIQVGF